MGYNEIRFCGHERNILEIVCLCEGDGVNRNTFYGRGENLLGFAVTRCQKKGII